MSSHHIFTQLQQQLRQLIIGQERLVDRLLIAMLADGHLLVEGAPGLAKTRAIKTLANHVEGDFKRIQFTPDLLPADVTGTEIYLPDSGEFRFQPGPVFSQILLADEINRAPAKVQSALLEAMAERQVSVGQKTYPLSELFLVMATQNPIEQEGTYSLPEAQLDRFLMHVVVDYPSAEHEIDILRLVRAETKQALQVESAAEPNALLRVQDIVAARREIVGVYMSEPVEQYLVRLINNTRQSAETSGASVASDWLAYGASPRGTVALDACARAHAWLQGEDFVSPSDIQAVAHDVLRHRLLLSYEAEADGITSDMVVDRLLSEVAVP